MMYDILDICNKYKNVLNIIDKSIIDIVSGKEMRGSLDFGDHFDFFPRTNNFLGIPSSTCCTTFYHFDFFLLSYDTKLIYIIRKYIKGYYLIRIL